MKFAFINRYRSQRWSVVLMCEVLNVSRAGFYRWLQRPPSRRACYNRKVLEFALQKARTQQGVPGYRKLWKEAVDHGFVCSQNRLQRLLQGAGYRSRRAPKPGLRRARGLPVLPNLLNRRFTVEAPNRVWVSDITQLRCEDGWLYVAVVIDLYARRIVGWSAGAQNSSWLVLKALNSAWKRRRPQGKDLLFHSDQGCQYTSEEVMRWLTRREVTISMSRTGNCWDNACAESFFAQMKLEWTRHLQPLDRKAMRAEVAYYIETYYNEVRRHGTLGLVSPAEFEAA